ncbi:MAG: hypothetical protein AAGI17_01355 [Planctomycetota bacterium]
MNRRHVFNAAVLALVSGAAISVSTAGVIGAEGPIGDAAPAAAFQNAEDLLGRGLAVQARALLENFSGVGSLTLTDAERSELKSLRGKIQREIAMLSPVQISLQSAQVAISRDELRDAERHAEAVANSSAADALEKSVADALLTMVRSRQSMLTAEAPATIAAAARAFDEGRYAEAKASLTTVAGWGLPLADGDQIQLSETLRRIADLESSRGSFGGAAIALAELGAAEEAQQPAQPAGQPAEDPVETARRVEAGRLLATANQAFADRRLQEAERAYGQVLQAPYRQYLTDEQITAAEDNLRESRLLLRGAEGPGGLIDDVQAERGVERQQLDAVVAGLQAESRRLLGTGDYRNARDQAAAARLEVNRGRDLYSDADYRAEIARINTLLDNIASAEQSAEINEQERRQRDLQQQIAEREAAVARERQEKINELIIRVRELQRERNYEKALQEVEQILFLDPLNPAGMLLRDVIKENLLYSRYDGALRDRNLSIAEQTVINAEASIAPDNMLEFPDDWAAITERRGGPLQYSEPENNRVVLDKLRRRRTQADFNEQTLENVLTFIGSIGELALDVDWNALDIIAVDRDTPVSLNLQDVTLETVLNRTLEKASSPDLPADWAVEDGVLTISSDEALRRNTVLEVYQIQDLILDIPDFQQAPQFDLNTVFQAGGQAGGGGGGGGGQSPFQQQQQQREIAPLEERVVPVIDVIRNNIDTDNWQANGGSTGRIETFQGNLIITNTKKNHREIYGLLNKLRAVRNLQINVESRFLLVDERFFEQIGFDLDVYLGGDLDAVRNLRSVNENIDSGNLITLDQFFDPITGAFIPGNDPNAVTATGVGLVAPFDGDPEAVEIPLGTPGITGPFDVFENNDRFTPIGFQQNSDGIVEVLGSTIGLGSSLTGLGPALSVAGRYLDDVQVDFMVEATQADTRSVTLNAPRVTFTNGQSSNIYVATQESFVAGLQPVAAGGAIAFSPQVGVVSTGVNLVVDGVVSADRRFVTLNVRTEIADVQLGGVLGNGMGGAAGGVGGGGAAGGNAVQFESAITLPTVTITSVSTTVTVPDQGTILLGGQRLIEEQEVEAGVPVLSKIPVLNRFFSNRLESKDESTLLILLRPQVIIQSEEEERAFPGLIDSIGG